MREVVSRRFARLGDVSAEEYDESFASPPNLVVIDGGKGQLAAALEAMQRFDLPRVAVIALAKREEEVFVPGRSEAIRLDRSAPGLQLLQRVRDEAHRFAVGFHRQRREKRGFESIFDTLEGVGPARRRALIAHFGSVEGVLAATPEELEGVPGVPPKTARSIYAQLHKAGRGMRLVLAAVLALACLGCGGAEEEDEGAPVAAVAGAEEPAVGEALTAFLEAADRGDDRALWSALSPQTQETMGPTYAEFRRGLAADLRDDLARQTGPPRVVQSRRVGPWGVAAATGVRVVEDEEEPYAFATAFRRVGGEWRVELGGAVALGLLPGHLDESDATPTLAATVDASGPLEGSHLWLDGEPLPLLRDDEGPFGARIKHELERELPEGWHVASVLATTPETAAAAAWAFEVVP